MGFARQLGNVLCLYGLRQGVKSINALEVGAGAFGVLTDPVCELAGNAQRAFGQGLGQRSLAVTAEIQRCGHQIKRAVGGSGAGVWCCCWFGHGKTTPAARSIWQVRISGRPTNAVGSSLVNASSKAMPRPSLLAEPAQS